MITFVVEADVFSVVGGEDVVFSVLDRGVLDLLVGDAGVGTFVVEADVLSVVGGEDMVSSVLGTGELGLFVGDADMVTLVDGEGLAALVLSAAGMVSLVEVAGVVALPDGEGMGASVVDAGDTVLEVDVSGVVTSIVDVGAIIIIDGEEVFPLIPDVTPVGPVAEGAGVDIFFVDWCAVVAAIGEDVRA